MLLDPLINCISIMKDNVRTEVDIEIYYRDKTAELSQKGLHFKDRVEFEETLLKVMRGELENLDNRAKEIYNDHPQFCD